MNTHGIGIHPDEGDLRPLGALARPRPTCTHSASDGYLPTRRPWIQYIRIREMGPENCQPRTIRTIQDGERAPWGRMASRKTTPSKKPHCPETETAPLIEETFAKPPDLGEAARIISIAEYSCGVSAQGAPWNPERRQCASAVSPKPP